MIMHFIKNFLGCFLVAEIHISEPPLPTGVLIDGEADGRDHASTGALLKLLLKVTLSQGVWKVANKKGSGDFCPAAGVATN